MSLAGLTLIGESINDSVPSTHTLFEEQNIDGIVELARLQAASGAAYVDVNIGPRAPGLMADVIRRIQERISAPLSIDTPDPAIAAAGLEAYDPGRAGGKIPVLNSISEARREMFDLYSTQPFIPILLITDGLDESGEKIINQTPEQMHATAMSLLKCAREKMGPLPNGAFILDPGILPIASDSKGDFRRLMDALTLLQQDAELAGVHRSVGLSNFTTMLPSKKPDGSPVKGPLENAFLTMAMPLGLDTIIGSVKRKYAMLPETDPALQCLREVLTLEGVDVITRVMMYYS